MKEPAEASPLYYVANFLLLVRRVCELYSDLLTAEERGYADLVERIPVEARRLYVRLLMRVGPIFRSDRISYTEITSVQAAATELESAGLLEIDGEAESQEVLSLLRIAELHGMFADHITGKKRKAELIEVVSEEIGEQEIRRRTGELFHIYRPLGLELLDRFRMLFFGNRYQSLAEFIVTELGVVIYETYRIDPSNRAFATRNEIDSLWSVYELRTEFEQSRTELDGSGLLELASRLPEASGSYHVDSRRERLLNDIARQLERTGDADAALTLFESTIEPPSRERRVRLLAKRGRESEARSLCEQIILSPRSEEEAEFGEAFSKRMRWNTEADDPETEESLYRWHTIEIPDPGSERVEVAALRFFAQAGISGRHTENGLWSGLFGLSFWDIIFAPLPGVFYNEFQRAPADISTPDFYLRRREAVEARLAEIEAMRGFKDWVLDRYDEKEGIANLFVQWRNLDRSFITSALDLIPKAHLLAVFKRVSRSPWTLTSGFPDLALFGENAAAFQALGLPVDSGNLYLLAEIKGPGDQLQRNQKRWLRFFASVSIPAVVVRVVYV